MNLNMDCNRLSPKRKSQQCTNSLHFSGIVTDYRLNANHNKGNTIFKTIIIVTDYRLNANHNKKKMIQAQGIIVTDYRLNSVHEFI